MAEVEPDKVSAILRRQLSGFEKEIDIYEVGTIIQIRESLARVYGLTKCMASELIEFPHEVFGMALNLEEDNVGCILFGDYTLLRKAMKVREQASCFECRLAKLLSAGSSIHWVGRSTARVR